MNVFHSLSLVSQIYIYVGYHTVYVRAQERVHADEEDKTRPPQRDNARVRTLEREGGTRGCRSKGMGGAQCGRAGPQEHKDSSKDHSSKQILTRQ